MGYHIHLIFIGKIYVDEFAMKKLDDSAYYGIKHLLQVQIFGNLPVQFLHGFQARRPVTGSLVQSGISESRAYLVRYRDKKFNVFRRKSVGMRTGKAQVGDTNSILENWNEQKALQACLLKHSQQNSIVIINVTEDDRRFRFIHIFEYPLSSHTAFMVDKDGNISPEI